MAQTATVWFERRDGERFSWAGPVTMTEAQRRAYTVDARELMADLSRRKTWPLYPAAKDIEPVSLEVVEADGRVSFKWTAPEEQA